MQQTTGRWRAVRRAALVLAAGLGPAVVLPALADVATAAGDTFTDPVRLARTDRGTVQRLVVAEAVRNGAVPAPLALAVVDVASDFVPRTVGSSGKVGLMQILPAAAQREFGSEAEGDALFDPATNVRLGLRRLADLHQRYGGDWELALSHFRGGDLPQADGRYRAHDFTRAYVDRVMRCWRGYARDRLVRAWIREARGERRFVADDTSPRTRKWATLPRDPAVNRGRAGGEACEACVPYDRGRYRAHNRRCIHDQPDGTCVEAAAPHRPSGAHRFHGGGRWRAIDGTPAPDFRHSRARWVAIASGNRFR